ncbi:MAG: extracellular solute-binding protein [Candidatus Kapaibacterium sp.]
MNFSALTKGARFAALLAIAVAAAGCPSKTNNTDSKGGGSMAVATEDKFKVPDGADPAVSAGLGGSGFEKIAADSGWQTSSLTPDQFRYVADTNAKKGGQFTFSFQEWPATFRAMGKDENTEATRFIYGQVYEGLINVNPMTLEFTPNLATHWKVGPDKQTYYFRIDPNARFSDGHPVTAEDVIATAKLGSDPTILSPYTNTFRAGFDTPEAVSKYIVKVHSKTLNWKNMFYFGASVVMPAHVIGNMTGTDYLKKFQYDMPPGSGPYVVAKPGDVENGKSIALTRRTNWWQKDYPINRGQNNFDKIKILIIRDENLEYEKLRSGELDFYRVSRAQWWRTKFDFPEITQRGLIQKRKIYTDDAVGFGGLAFNTRRAPFSDPKVREALIYLFNRDQILEKVLYNEYVAINSFYPNSPYANPSDPKQEYSPEKAAQLLAEAGYTQRNAEGILMKDGKPFVIDMPFVQQLAHIITPIQQDFLKAGIKINLREVDQVTQFKLANDRNFDMIYQQWGGLLYPNPISSFQSALADQNNTNNTTGFKNSRADELMKMEQTEFDQAKRTKILQELDSILVGSKQYALNWVAPFNRLVYWNKFGHPDFYLGRISDWQGAIATWWYDPDKAAALDKARKDPSAKLDIGETDVKFWPEFDKTHIIKSVDYTASGSANDSSKKNAAGEAAKPSIK